MSRPVLGSGRRGLSFAKYKRGFVILLRRFMPWGATVSRSLFCCSTLGGLKGGPHEPTDWVSQRAVYCGGYFDLCKPSLGAGQIEGACWREP
jgi:hypothetical protein